MKSDTNIISVTGIIDEVQEDYYLLKVSRISEIEDWFRIWNMPRHVPVGAVVTVLGTLASQRFGEDGCKKVVGINAEYLATHGYTHNMLIVTGKVIAKPKMRVTLSEKVIQEVTIENEEGDQFPVIIWNKLAIKADKDIKLGDNIRVSGFLASRTYEKEIGSKKVPKSTVEISTIFYEKC